MRTIFADTFYWTASINPRDNWHGQVIAITRTLEQFCLVTTEEVLAETLTFFSAYGSQMRQRDCQLVHGIIKNTNTQVIHQTHESFLACIPLYKNRPDNEYSFLYCISMHTFREQ